MNMTYRKLAESIKNFSDEQKDMSVTVYVPGIDEFYPIGEVTEENRSDVLDIGHPVLQIPNEDWLRS